MKKNIHIVLGVSAGVHLVGHVLRIVMLLLINSKSLPWYLGEGDFKQRREET